MCSYLDPKQISADICLTFVFKHLSRSGNRIRNILLSLHHWGCQIQPISLNLSDFSNKNKTTTDTPTKLISLLQKKRTNKYWPVIYSIYKKSMFVRNLESKASIEAVIVQIYILQARAIGWIGEYGTRQKRNDFSSSSSQPTYS